MKLWVYIYKDAKDELKICLSADIGNLTSNQQAKSRIVYLCPFDIPFNAMAHKHLLDDLSKESVMNWIDKNSEETDVWLRVINQN